MILIIFDKNDKKDQNEDGTPNEVAKRHFDIYITINAIMMICMAAPALFLIREKPPSPPSMVATKSRPV